MSIDKPVQTHPFLRYPLDGNIKDLGKQKLHNHNFLAPNNFRMSISPIQFENINFTIQNVTLPGMEIGFAELPGKMLNTPYPGDKIQQFSPLEITFLIDEFCINYIEINMWIMSCVNMQEKHVADTLPTMRTIDLFILDSHNNPAVQFIFHDAFPTSISSMQLDANTTDVEYIVGNVSFAYSYYTIRHATNQRANLDFRG